MTAAQIIGEVVALPAAERAAAIRLARSLEADRLLQPDALAMLADRLAGAASPAEAQTPRDAIEAGFYGRPGNA